MGLECYFTLKRKKDKMENIKTVKEYEDAFIDLLWFCSPSMEFEDLILDCCTRANKMCFKGLDNKIVYKTINDDNHYIVDFNKFKAFISNLKYFNIFCSKYPKRTIDYLGDYLECEDKRMEQCANEIQNALYDVDTQLGISDAWRIIKLYKFFSQFFSSDIDLKKYELFYIRSE